MAGYCLVYLFGFDGLDMPFLVCCLGFAGSCLLGGFSKAGLLSQVCWVTFAWQGLLGEFLGWV